MAQKIITPIDMPVGAASTNPGSGFDRVSINANNTLEVRTPSGTIYPQRVRPMGVWSSGTAYEPSDLVIRNTSSVYCCILTRSATGTPPESDASHWTAIYVDQSGTTGVVGEYAFNTTLGPGSTSFGDMKFNNATQNLTTVISLAEQDYRASASLNPTWASIVAMTAGPIKGYLRLSGVDFPSLYMLFRVTAISQPGPFDNRTDFTVVHMASSSASPFAAGHRVFVSMIPGDANPMTTTDDIILGGVSGAMTRSPKGSAAKGATLVVAASNASAIQKLMADYVCDGVADQVEMNAALTALPSIGGRVLLTEGTFIVSATGVTTAKAFSHLQGSGRGTLIQAVASGGAAVNIWLVSIFHDGCILSDFRVDGNKATNGAQTSMACVTLHSTNGIIENVHTSNSASVGILTTSSANDGRVKNCSATSCATHGFQIDGIAAAPVVVEGCMSAASANMGFYVPGAGAELSNCVSRSSGQHGFYLAGVGNQVVGCRALSNTSAGFAPIATDCVISGCFAASNGLGLSTTADRTTGIGNNFSGGAYGIAAGGHDGVFIGNICRSNNTFGITATGNNILFQGNYIDLAQAHGFVCSGVDCIIQGNYIIRSNQGNGSFFNMSVGSNNTVTGNICRQGALTFKPTWGIVIGVGTTNVMLANNDFYNAGTTGEMADNNGNGVTRRPVAFQLNYAATTDLFNTTVLTANVWVQVMANQNFAVLSSSSVLEFVVRCSMLLGNGAAAGHIASRLVIDSANSPFPTVTLKFGGAYQSGPNLYANPFTGATTLHWQNLAIGTHTVRLEVYPNITNTAFLRAFNVAHLEWLSLDVLELFR